MPPTLLDLLFEDDTAARCLATPDGRTLRANAAWVRAFGDGPLEEPWRSACARAAEGEPAAAGHAGRVEPVAIEEGGPPPDEGRRPPGGRRAEGPLSIEEGGPPPDEGRRPPGGRRAEGPLSINGRALLLTAAPRAAVAEGAAEQALKDALERLELTLRFARAGVFEWDVETGRLWWSPENYDLFHVSPDEPLSYARWEQAVHPDDVVETNARVAAALAGTGTDFRSEFRVMAPGGGIRWLVGLGRVDRHPDGRPRRMLGLNLDITERMRVEDALRESEAHLALALDAAELGTWAFDLVDGAGRHSDRLAGIFGYAEAVPGWSYDTFLAHLVPEDRAHVDRDFRAAAAGGGDWRCECRVRRPDGTLGWISGAGRLERDAEGRPRRMVGVVHDVTERKHADEVIRQEERKYRSLFEGSMDAVYVTRDGGTILDANPAACRLHGMTVDEIRAAGRTGLVVQNEALSRGLAARAAQGGWRGELTMRRRDGTEFPVELDTVRVDVDAEFNAFVIARDITERVRSHEALRRLAAAVEQAPASIVITDAAGVVEYVNPAYERVMGFPRGEVLGRLARVLAHGDGAARDPEIWATVSGGRVWQGRRVARARDGRVVTEDVVIAPVVDEGGVIRNYVAVKRDVSRELALQERLAQSQKLESVGRLAGGIAHDFNNILTVILTCAEDLREGLLGADELLRGDVDEIVAASGRARDLTRQLLSFARRQPLAPVALDLNALLAGAERLLRRLIGEDIQFAVSPGPDLWRVRADPGQLEQVIFNLAVNARDAMPEGGTLVIETSNLRAGLAETALFPGMTPGDYVRLAVKDTGVGMSPEVRDHVFEPFFTTRPGKGTGLGLATVYGVVTQSHGFIHVDSRPGVGTTMEVCLPRTTDAPLADAPGAGPPARVGTETVLLVEDNAQVRELAARALRGSGYRVLLASDGVEAVEIADRTGCAFDLLLTDVVMPRLGGKALAEELRRRRPGLRVLFMSGYAPEAGPDGAILPGIKLLPKPFTPAELQARVREALDA